MITPPNTPTAFPLPDPAAARTRAQDAGQRFGLWLILALLAATFFLLSPPRDQTYPGAVPWRSTSVLRPLVDVLSLGGTVATIRGVEIKTLAFHVAVVLGLLLAGYAAWTAPTRVASDRPGRLAGAAQFLLCAWVALALASSLWAYDAGLARGQALLYAMGVAWAAAVAFFFDRRWLPELLWGVAIIGALGGALCIWYYAERNPFHRPGFPLGNPALVGAAMLPGSLASISILIAATSERRAAGAPRRALSVVILIVLLTVQLACLVVTGARGPGLALFAGIAVLIVLSVGSLVRWRLGAAFAVLLIVGGLALYQLSYQDVAMARGAATRFRLYAWQAAAQLWQLRPISGNGAGVYPRVAGELTANDRILDPAAFMSELVEHAHNELFEVFAEIGLFGGVTIVAGLLATAAAAMRRATQTPASRDVWLLRGVAAIVAALIADALVGVNPRLPGGAALLFTFIGVLWALCAAREPLAGKPRAPAGAAIAFMCFAAAISGSMVAYRDWGGVQAEAAADRAMRTRDFAAARGHAVVAASRLLDPVRVIAARKTAIEAAALDADAAFAKVIPATKPAESDPARELALVRTEAVYAEAVNLAVDVPGLERPVAIAARAAERLAALRWQEDANVAREWRLRAEIAWRQQRERTPYDVETNMALLRYRGSLANQLALLRDALRFGGVDALWIQALAPLAQAPEFQSSLGDLIIAASAVGPESDHDAIMASSAPEAFRLGAAYNAMKGQLETAVAGAARAEKLYRAVQSRLPESVSVALMEQADYLMQAPLANAPQAAASLQLAIKELPRIQAQKYELLARPLRLRLVRALLVAGREDEAREVQLATLDDAAVVNDALATAYVDLAVAFVRRPADARPPIRGWLDAAVRLAPTSVLAWSWQAWLDAESGSAEAVNSRLASAVAAGVTPDGVALIRRSLCREFPPLCESLGEPP